MSTSPYLTDEEIFEICRPLRQGAAQIRQLKAMGIKVHRRPDGTPLVWRADVAQPSSAAAAAAGGGQSTVGASNEPAWTRPRHA